MTEVTFPGWRGTNIVGVHKGGKVLIMGDGQISLGQTVIKGTAGKVRRLSAAGQDAICEFAVSTANAFTLLERLDSKLEASPEQFARANVNLAKDWCPKSTCKNWSDADRQRRNPRQRSRDAAVGRGSARSRNRRARAAPCAGQVPASPPYRSRPPSAGLPARWQKALRCNRRHATTSPVRRRNWRSRVSDLWHRYSLVPAVAITQAGRRP